MAQRALLRGLGVVALCLAAPSCGGGEEWVCNGSEFTGVNPENEQTCNIAWSCEGQERFEFVTLQIDCRQDGDRFLCHCSEMDPSTGTPLRSDEAFEASSDICRLSPETADLVNGGCGWAVPEEL